MFKTINTYKVRKIFPEVYQIRNCDVNMFLIVGKQRMLLFDTGFGFADLHQVIDSISSKPL